MVSIYLRFAPRCGYVVSMPSVSLRGWANVPVSTASMTLVRSAMGSDWRAIAVRCPMDGRWCGHTYDLSLYNDIGEMSASILTITGVIVSINGHGLTESFSACYSVGR